MLQKSVFSLLRKVDKQSLLGMLIGSEFQTLGAATLHERSLSCLSSQNMSLEQTGAERQ